MILSNVLGSIACASFAPDPCKQVIELKDKSRLISLQSNTVLFTYWWQHVIRTPLNWTDEGALTRDIRAYRPIICSLRRIVDAKIFLAMTTATIDVTGIKVYLRFLLAKKAI